jgi:hypothetical protein
MKRQGVWVLVVSGTAILSGCGGTESHGASGGEGQPCYPNATCNADLTCASHLCVRLPDDRADAGKHVGGSGGRDAGTGLIDPIDSGSSGAKGAGAAPGLACDAGRVRIGGMCVAPGASCTSGFPGDGQCLTPPDPALGLQLHYGPSNYDDPAELEKFIVPPGAFSRDCLYMKTSNSTDVHVSATSSRLRPGVQRFFAFAAVDAHADTPMPVACGDSTRATILTAAFTPNSEFAVAGSVPAPEHEGWAIPLKARAQAMLEVDAANTTETPLLKEAWVNVSMLPEAQVKAEVSSVTWFGGLTMHVPPHVRQLVTAQCAVSSTEGDRNLLRLVAVTGSHTPGVAVFVQPAAAANRHKIYERFDWSDPFAIQYGSTMTNPAPDSLTGVSGGASGDLVIHAGDKVTWECDVNNDTDASLNFGASVYTQEFCNLFGWYGPGAAPWVCVGP